MPQDNEALPGDIQFTRRRAFLVVEGCNAPGEADDSIPYRRRSSTAVFSSRPSSSWVRFCLQAACQRLSSSKGALNHRCPFGFLEGKGKGRRNIKLRQIKRYHHQASIPPIFRKVV